MNKLYWVSSAHRVHKEKKFANYFYRDFDCILLPDIKIALKNNSYNNSIKESLKLFRVGVFKPLLRINFPILIKIIIQDQKKRNLNIIRFFWLSYRVFWIATFDINENDIFIFRGLNDPLIKYLKRTYPKNYIYLLPHGTNFIEPISNYWKYSDFWVTDFKKFQICNNSTKLLKFGRLDYFDIPRQEVHNKILRTIEIKNIGIVFSHTKIELLKSQIYKIRNFLKFLDLKPNIIIRLHPGDHRFIPYLLKNNLYCKLSLEQFFDKSDILLFPENHRGFVTSLYYESNFRGKVSAAIINDNKTKKNLKNLLISTDKNIVPLDNYSFCKWFNNLSKIGFSNKVILNEFISSKNIRQKLLKHFLQNL